MEPELEPEPSQPDGSLGSLFAALGRQISTLFRLELALARAEISEKVRQAGAGLVLLAAGGMAVLIGLFFIVQGAVFGVVALLDIWLPAGVAVWLGPLLVGLAVVLIGWVLLSRGGKKLSAESLAMQRTAQSLRENSAIIREHLP